MPMTLFPGDQPEPIWQEEAIWLIHNVIESNGGSFAGAVMGTVMLRAAMDIAHGRQHPEITVSDVQEAVKDCDNEENSDDFILEVRRKGKVVGYG